MLEHTDLARALARYETSFYVNPDIVTLLTDGMRDHAEHPEWCRGDCRATVAAESILAGAA